MFSMPEMGIAAYPSPLRHAASPYLLQNGADIDIYKPLKASKHPTMANQSDLMMLLVFHAYCTVGMTPFYGMIMWRFHFGSLLDTLDLC